MQSFKIYYTSDIHGYLFPTDYTDQQEKALGLLKVIANFNKDGNTLILDGGDIFQGSPYINFFQKKQNYEQGVAQLMNAAGYDVITLGNHDFNYSFQALKENLSHIDAKVSAVNVTDASGNLLFPTVLKTLENGLKVGIVGITTDFTNIWENPQNIVDIRINKPFEAAKVALESIKDKVDVTICLYHGGFEADLVTGELLFESGENIGYKIAKELSFDLLLTGHQHASIEGQYLFGTYIVQPTNMGKNYFEIEGCLVENNLKIKSKLKIPNNSYDKNLAENLLPLEQEVQNFLSQPIGHLPVSIAKQTHLEFATMGSPWVELVGAVEMLKGNADIAVVSSFNQLNSIPKSLTIRDIMSNYPYDNTLYIVKMNGRMLKQAIEHSAEYFSYVQHEGVVLNPRWLSPKLEHYNYDFFIGIEYALDIRRPVGNRVVSLKYHQADVQPTDSFVVALNNYRALGGGGYEIYQQASSVFNTGVEIQQLLIDFIQNNSKAKLPYQLKFTVLP
ncbi:MULTISPECIES: bifunctional UDP-sugar hydrolase/5'-nucleotidase [unclassified Enterococcus]|uniref:bifunctional metallophosphatase/5'-nucleotidase n=1 Tax=unclassified Enterococcus TaxID=2608891 RepID=UPI0015564046|nr:MULTISPECIES: bifunctional UDP-sugar hydrolase/5'-nucleotidase [unclassified Enterococcus]MBS7576813.1 bifunctional metallophosphatase/5'-nucleotidase [Enterococcus sp. MMGLQ5-2]MBS7584220.1 bifunctional metallophosphatase/5'-nucleotidase [Enterococcus sp. MMGLQ5-1]NPD12076.1 bifunctional metallophosphatase/5'-nucleotidase [Enterococcus sp. MMGLQ5-1]NPD36648.1 bifunctional metallophosphatase/5'-nucleotidase [Enterococcus sp. MMGLQ5-2]